ncbi:MAG: EAL domain-containing protein [Oscillospiraceae bacterium]
MKKDFKTPKWWIALSAFCVVTIVVFGYFFIRMGSEGLYEEKVAYLEEISKKGTQLVTEQINGYFSTLEVISTIIGGDDDFTVDSALAVLKNEMSKGFFKRMGIITPDGTAYTTDGYTEDFNDRKYFKEALTGKNATSDCLIDKIGGEEINVFATPIYHNGIIVGVVFATKSQEELSKSLVIESFSSKGYSYIVSGDGRPVIKTNNPESIGEYTNFFDVMVDYGVTPQQLSTVQSHIKSNTSGTLEYTRQGVLRQMFYSPVGINDWYVFSVVPVKVISFQSDQLIRNLGLLAMIIVLLSIIICSRMIKAFKKNNTRLKHLAYTDSVTGHPNWVKFRLDVEELLSLHPERKYAMIAFDINKFKLINGLFGYQRGDEILTFVGDVLFKNLDNNEAFCRASADHFNVLMQYKSEDEIVNRLKSIEDELDRCINNYKIKISSGICTIKERDLDVSVYSDKANISRDIAKKQNSLSYHFFKDENRIELLREKGIEDAMDNALANGEFLVYLQPKYSAKEHKPVGAEALVRWNRPNEGLVFPNDFIPIFEKNGFIRSLDLYMFESVCKLMVQWQKNFKSAKNFSVSVNISRAHLSNPELANDLKHIADKYEISQELLEIELTESAVFENMEEMHILMNRLKEVGFKLSIDDFGSGYSSLASLKSLPADVVKMDKSFLDEAEHDKRGEKVIFGMIEMIKGLDMLTVAEGVETLSQLEFLVSANCDIVQGYYFAKPMPVKDFENQIFIKDNLPTTD